MSNRVTIRDIAAKAGVRFKILPYGHNHMVMQTIAQANVVFPDKHTGVIVDYACVRLSGNDARHLRRW